MNRIGNLRVSLPQCGENWTSQEVKRLTFLAAPSWVFKHSTLARLMPALEYSVLEPGIFFEIEQHKINAPGKFSFPISKECYFIGIVMEIQGFQIGFRVLGDENERIFWKSIRQLRHIGWGESKGCNLFIPKTRVTADDKENYKAECKGRITIPNNIIDFLNNDATRTGTLFNQSRIISVFGKVYEGSINGLASTRVRIISNQNQDIWLDSKSEYLIPKLTEKIPDEESDIFAEIFKDFLDADQSIPKRPLALEFLDEWTGTFHVGIIKDCRRDGYITVVKDPEEVKRWRLEESAYMFHFTSPCLLPYGTVALQTDVTGESKLRHHSKVCYGIIDAPRYIQNWAVPAPFHRLAQNHTDAPSTKFQVGMKLEAVDIYPGESIGDKLYKATVKDVWSRFILIHFDGLSPKFDKWISASSTEIYPVGWCDLHKNFDTGDTLRLEPIGGEPEELLILPEGPYRIKNLSQWTAQDLAHYFSHNGLEEVIQTIVQREISGPQFLGMNRDDLRFLVRGDDDLVSKLIVFRKRLLAITTVQNEE